MQILHLGMSTDRRQTFAINYLVKSKLVKKYYAYIYTDTNLAVNHLSLTAKFLSVYSYKHKSRS